jgi:hypothetical protein
LSSEPETLDPNDRLFAISGGFSAQGSVTESFRNADGHGWSVTQSSGNTTSLHVFAYCVATSDTNERAATAALSSFESR